MKTNSVQNDKTKEVNWSYPTSDNAEKFGFGKVGCWTVSYVWRGDLAQPPKAIKGFALKSEAEEFAAAMPEDWSASTKLCRAMGI